MSQLLIETPKKYTKERNYILSVVLGDRLGLDWTLKQTNRQDVRISFAGTSLEIILSDEFFSIPKTEWCTKNSLPKLPLKKIDTAAVISPENNFLSETLMLYGDNNKSISKSNTSISIPIDIFGSSFFLLTRYEEMVLKDEVDLHGRFQASGSVLGKSNYLLRPMVDEYELLLWASMQLLWPSLERKKSSFSIRMTHDVDIPFGTKGTQVRQVARRLAGDLLCRKNPTLAIQRLSSFIIPGLAGAALDPNNTFSWIMDNVEKNGLKSKFNFMACEKSIFDDGYDITSSRMATILKSIDRRGHTIGFHPSYDSQSSELRFTSEVKQLQRGLKKAGVQQQINGGRHHYLRWKAGSSWELWNATGLKYDSSVGYAETVGFRSGTCKPYRTWSYSNECELNLEEHPLVMMDTTLLSKVYMGLDDESCKELIDRLVSVVKFYRGELVTLWHNDIFIYPRAREIFLYILQNT